MGFTDRLEDGSVKEWFLKDKNPNRLEELAWYAENGGYKLNSKTGLFTRYYKPREQMHESDGTNIDIVFLRPSDYHFHPKMEEKIKILMGRGILILGNEPYEQIQLSVGNDPIIIQESCFHAFSPLPGDCYLEIRVATSRIYDDTQEITAERFDKFKPWKNLFSR